MKTMLALLLLALPALAFAGETRLTIGQGFDQLNHGYADWRATDIGISTKPGDGSAYFATARSVDRFSLHDSELSIGATMPFCREWLAIVEASGSPEHQVLARSAWSGEVTRKLPEGWLLSVGAKRAFYTTDTLDAEHARVERYFGSWRAAFSATLSQLDSGGTTSGGAIALDHYFNDRDSLGLIMADGHEATRTDPATLQIVSTRSIALITRRMITNRLGLEASIAHSHQGHFYDRNSLHADLSWRF